ncbi:ATP-binding cassette domain-containing protein [Plectonema cf. radiosum LEGE 06105]|uniref:ATP-binding cassette domain-containing protein n=1 Tax=Plectonema cf. radiosum LEGE 06105 TaxID=945769 RepID=A0A8J7FAW6_9CYAN|nr:ATP-binding cassette domain-containing protein [Plectonema radiosum]MBE9214974.1 ATP-binding cassette domain-containing protein [Plectonema cf. radiosum LEGE 06105]
MREQPLIQLKGVSKSFGSNKILDQVDFNIYPGDALGIIGPSGTGKSTILRIIAGLTAADEGEIFIQGVRREGLVEDGVDALGIGMVFQQAALFDSLTVDENVGFLLYQHSSLSKRRIRKLVEEKLEMVGLPGVADRFPSELSGGMRKRVSFARAIISNPEKPEESPSVLLYDEPTAGLDPIASTIIEDLIRQLQVAEGTSSSYAIVTHQHSTIRRTADRIVFLYQGKVQWAGKVSEVDTTEHPSIRQFMSGNIDGPIKIAGA